MIIKPKAKYVSRGRHAAHERIPSTVAT